MWITTPRRINDYTDVSAGVTNGPLDDLKSRTDFLYQLLTNQQNTGQLILYQQPVSADTVIGMPVYFDSDASVFKPAWGDVIEGDNGYYITSPTSMWKGIVVELSGTVASIAYGSVTLTTTQWAAVIDTGIFAIGDYYLGEDESIPGIISANPGVLGIYIGHLRSNGQMLLNLSGVQSYQQHIHLGRALVGDPAGTVTDPAIGDPQIVNAPDPSLPGWLPATSTYFPGFVTGVQIPTGAKFGYNIQHTDETALRQVFPVTPPDNAQFSQAGVLLYSTTVVINNYGIWWMINDYGSAPWPVDYAVSAVADDVFLYTTRIVAEAQNSEVVTQAVINDLSSGAINSLAVSSIKSGDLTALAISGGSGDNTSGFKGATTITNKGVTALRVGPRLSVRAASLAGNNTIGYKGLIDLDCDVRVPMLHNWTEYSGSGEAIRDVSTNGAPIGTYVGLMGHALGPSVSGDYIDFVLPFDVDIEYGVDYQPIVRIAAGVDTVTGTETYRDVDVSFFVYTDGGAISDSAFQKVVSVEFIEGVPGQMQMVALGPYADVIVQRGNMLHIRVSHSTSGNPLTPDTLRIVGITCGLYRA